MSDKRAKAFRAGTMIAEATMVGCLFAEARAAEKPMVVVPFRDARFVPVDANRPDGAALAVLWGDPSSGPSAMLLKFKKGAGSMHSHGSDYHLVMLEGTAKHWAEGDLESAAAALGPGSYWFQPGGKVHGDSCLTDECLMFVQWAGKRDGKLVEPSKSSRE